MLTPFDALIDAIVHYSGYRIPSSAVYRARNPGALKAFSPVANRDSDGNRVFKSEIDGLQALKFDVRLKISGKAKAQCATLNELAAAFGQPATQAKAWAGFIRQALGDDSINGKTALSFFTDTEIK